MRQTSTTVRVLLVNVENVLTARTPSLASVTLASPATSVRPRLTSVTQTPVSMADSAKISSTDTNVVVNPVPWDQTARQTSTNVSPIHAETELDVSMESTDTLANVKLVIKEFIVRQTSMNVHQILVLTEVLVSIWSMDLDASVLKVITMQDV